VKLRRLEAADAPAFQRLRIEGFTLQPREFRYAPEDEADMPLAEVAARLAARGGITALLFNRYCSSPIIKTLEVIYVPRTSDTSCHPR